MRTPAEVYATYDQQPCPNCADGCTATRYCDGCDMTICEGCYAEHNEDAPDHEEGETA